MSADQRHTHNPIPGEGLAGGHPRRLIYLPIVHTQADMGALKESVARATLGRRDQLVPSGELEGLLRSLAKFSNGGIRLTPPAPTCSIGANGH